MSKYILLQLTLIRVKYPSATNVFYSFVSNRDIASHYYYEECIAFKMEERVTSYLCRCTTLFFIHIDVPNRGAM